MRPGAFPVICAQDLALLSALRQQFTLLDDVPHTSPMGCGKPLFNFNALQAGKCRLNQDPRRTEEQKLFADPLSTVFLSCEGSFFFSCKYNPHRIFFFKKNIFLLFSITWLKATESPARANKAFISQSREVKAHISVPLKTERQSLNLSCKAHSTASPSSSNLKWTQSSGSFAATHRLHLFMCSRCFTEERNTPSFPLETHHHSGAILSFFRIVCRIFLLCGS